MVQSNDYILSIFNDSVAKREVPFEAIETLKNKILQVEDRSNLSQAAEYICNEMLQDLVETKCYFLTFHWLNFLYETFGDVISKMNLKKALNRLLLVHRTLFAGDELMKKLAFDLWSIVIDIVHRFPGTS